MSPLLAVSLLVLLVVTWVLYRMYLARASRMEQSRPAVKTTKSSNQFHAVSIRFPGSACEAAKAMKDKRFLSSAAPRLPLLECDVLECKCRFVHYADRRTGEDRRTRIGGSITGGTGEHQREQRQSGERRADPPDDY